MTGKLSDHVRFFILCLILLTGYSVTVFSQKKISGIVNKYARVNSMGADLVQVDDEAQFGQFSEGDTVLLIQMKGVRILVREEGSYGFIEYNYGLPGQHEFLIVESVNDATNTITFKNNIVDSDFSVQGDIQIVKVPSYNYAEVDATLSCQPWDSISKTGGVLAAIVGNTLSLKADIDVTGKGFAGGKASQGLGICAETDRMYEYAYSGLSDSAGFKGEGPVSQGWITADSIYPLYPFFAKGKGPSLTGGGGGDGRFSGGGGGGNYGAGGLGGKEEQECGFNFTGGLGGLQVKSTYLGTTLKSMLLGGGGGSSTYLTVNTATDGGNGGGIVILVCDTLKGNGYSILAEGASPSLEASGDAGAGGGGGGGTIGLYLQSYSVDPLTSGIILSSKGGKGGNTTSSFGEGGGGGGGFITTNNTPLPANGSFTVEGGMGGTRAPGITGQPGQAGDTISDFTPVLNGFLFNSVRSLITGTQVDSICSDTPFPGFTGTIPIGGTTPYSYLWEYSTTSENDGFSPVPGVNNQINYTPPESFLLTQDTWFRRVVTDAGSTPVTDISKAVKVIVHQAITGNLVGSDTTICYGQDPLSLIPLNSGPSNGNGYYQYQWLANTDNTTWTVNAPGSSASEDYDPAALTTTTWYKRYVTSGRCVSYSPTVTVTVLPLITGNVTARPDSVICQGSLFPVLSASDPEEGSGSYIYEWQDSTAAGSWQAAPGVNTNPTYNVDTSQFTSSQNRYYRRIVYSGPDNVCKSSSLPIELIRYFSIQNNEIASDTTICSGSVPLPLEGTVPTGGDGTYSYSWEQSDDGLAWESEASGSNSLKDYSPPELTDSTWYRRVVSSSKCMDISNIVVVNVHKPILNNIAALLSGAATDTTICSGSVPNMIRGSIPSGGTDIEGDYAYQWSYSTDNNEFTDITESGTLRDYQPGELTVTTWFRRRVISGTCSSESNSIKITVLPPITNNVITSAKTSVCYNQIPAPLTGTALTGGANDTPEWVWEESTDGIDWTPAAGTNDQQNYSPPPLTTKRWYRRIIFSGPENCCYSISNEFEIDIDPLPTGIITSVSDTSICNGGQVKLRVRLTGSPEWTLTYNENSTAKVISGITASDTVLSITPVPTGSMSVFNYSLVSLTDNNGCAATSLSGSRKANVYNVPVADAGPDNQVCGFEYQLAAVPSVGTGLWSFPPQVVSSVAGDPTATVWIDSSFNTASVSYKFYWEEINWQCVSRDSVTITFFNPIDTISAGADSAFMSFDYLVKLNAYPLQSFESGKWSVVNGTGDFDDDTKNDTDVRNISAGLNTYEWTVTNGPCQLKDVVNMEVTSAVIPEAISPNGDNINDELIITGFDPVNQKAELTIVNGAGTIVFSTSNQNNNVWENWNGRSSQGIELPEGTYYYLLKIISEKTGSVIPNSGFIILKRR